MRHGYPIVLDVTERLAVIVGGGQVAARKATALTEAGARQVRVVAPQFTAVFPASVVRVTQSYVPQHLEGAELVFAATDCADVNEAVVRDARARRILVNRVDSSVGEPGDFVTPARLADDEMVVSVNAGSAALSAYVRDQLAARWEPVWSEMARIMQGLRPLVHQRVNDPSVRREVFRDLASDHAMQVLKEHGSAGLQHWVAEKYPALREQVGRE
jgi:siroheme synthase-like protein